MHRDELRGCLQRHTLSLVDDVVGGVGGVAIADIDGGPTVDV